MSKKQKLGLSILVLLLCFTSYGLGLYVSREALNKGSADIQAMLAFNHIGNYSKIQNCLNKENYKATSTLLENYIITERELLASHLNNGATSKITNYIKLRTKEGLEAHKQFISNRGNSWKVPRCK